MNKYKVDWFGPRLKALRDAAGLTLDELGERVGLHATQISKLELVDRQPTLGTALALAEALGIELADFLPEEMVAEMKLRKKQRQRGKRGE
jgi:XRE family transcriptional regulator, fatty acid utilization regulator